MNKKSNLKLLLNSVSNHDDPTLLKATFIIHDFEESWNGQVITKEVALENAHTLLNKPIVAKYFPSDDNGTTNDALGSHEQYLSQDRYGKDKIKMDTVAIGVIVTEGYELTVNDQECLAVDAVLWRSRHTDVCDLLLEWYQRGVRIVSSVEYLYMNYTHRDNVEYIESPIYYDGHCLLNAEDRGEHDKVLPAYDSSHLLSFNDLTKFNRLVAQAASRDDVKEGAKLFKKVCELSHSDIRSRLYQQLDPTIEDGWAWIAEVYNDRFIAEVYKEDDTTKFYQFNYTSSDEVVTIDFESKAEVVEKREWVTSEATKELQEQLNAANEKVQELSTEMSSLNEKLETTNQEKQELTTQFNEASDKVLSLNSTIEEYKSYKDKYETEQFEKSLNEKIEFYSVKFNSVNAKEKFESEEVQELIKLSVNEDEQGVQAKYQLNTMLVDLVQPSLNHKNNNQDVYELANSRSRLLNNEDFDSKYSL